MNCKKGERAVIVRANHAENIGRVVDVGAFAGYDEDGPLWHIHSCGSPILCAPDNSYLMELYCPDAWLRPIQPVHAEDVDAETQENSEQTEAQVTAKAPAG